MIHSSPSSITDLRAVFDRQYRFQSCPIETEREEAGPVLRLIRQVEPRGIIPYHHFSVGEMEAVVRHQVEYYQGLGLDLEWNLYEHDQPSELGAYLQSIGFEGDDVSATMVLDLEQAPAELLQPVIADVRRLQNPAELADVMAVLEPVWKVKLDWLPPRLGRHMRNYPDWISVYVAYVDEQPAATAWTYYFPGSQFGGLRAGSTLPAYRHRGLYTALLAMRIQESLQRGARFLVVDSTADSQPILTRHGFINLGTGQSFVLPARKNE